MGQNNLISIVLTIPDDNFFYFLFYDAFSTEIMFTFGLSEGDAVTVTTGRYTKVIIGRHTEGPNCTVCLGEGSSQTCLSRHVISETQTVQVTFTCSSPQDIFTIEINRDFGKWH